MAKTETERLDELDKRKSEFLEYFGNCADTLDGAARKTGRTRQTIWNWRQADKTFDEAFKKADDQRRALQLSMVEDSLYARIIKEKAKPAEVIFWLKRHSRPWALADKAGLEITGEMTHHTVLSFEIQNGRGNGKKNPEGQ